VSLPDGRIFEAVLTVWNNRGLSATTLKRVGEAAGVGEATLLRRFGSRDKLIRLAFRQLVDDFCREFSATGDLQSDLTSFATAFRSLSRRRGRLLLDLVLESSRPDRDIDLARSALLAANQIARVVATYQADGRLRGNNPWEAILCFAAPFLLPAMQPDSQRMVYPSATGNIAEFLNGWASPQASIEKS